MLKKKKIQNVCEPYRQRTSIIYHAFTMARSGCKIDDIRKMVLKVSGSPVRILRRLRSGFNKGYQWDVDESNGWIKVLNVRAIPTQNGQTTSKSPSRGK